VLASDADLNQILEQGLLLLDPLDQEMIQPASIDLRLDHRFRMYSPVPNPGSILDRPSPVIDPALDQPEMTFEVEVPAGESFLLPANSFALAATMERVKLSREVAAHLEGKSGLGRLGLLVHATAGWIDPGFQGTITLELFNAAPWPIRLHPGMKIAQLAVMLLRTPAQHPYGSLGRGSHYQFQAPGPQPSQTWRNFRTWPTRQKEPVRD
jgi:dCTP deaminase